MSDTQSTESTAAAASNISLQGILRIPAVRQVLLLVGITASVAAGFAVVLWSQDPSYTTLYRNLPTSDIAQVADTLSSAGIDHKIDTESGIVMVANAELHTARLELASQNITAGAVSSMGQLQERSGFGVSQFMESTAYQEALQADLAATISHLGAVRNARVHLAMPRQSSFLRDRNAASASVFLELGRGMALEPDQASAIVNLVASSVPNLPPENVTLVDQYSRMLNSSGDKNLGAQVGDQLRYTQQLEQSYKQRIENLLTALVGPGRVRAEVNASLDFTLTEETRESFDPEQTVVRSEQINEEELRGQSAAPAGGVPGAQSNLPAQTEATEAEEEETETNPVNLTRMATRNYEVDRTISRVQPSPVQIQRLSVAVLIDDSPAAAAEGAEGTPAATAIDVNQITDLTREVIGFNEARGDTLRVTLAPFQQPSELPAAEAPPIWEHPLVIDIVKLVLGAGVAIALGFGLIRPMFRSLLTSGNTDGVLALAGPSTAPALASAGGSAAPAALAGGGRMAIAGPNLDDKLTAAKNITSHDPARVAQIVRRWLDDDSSAGG